MRGRAMKRKTESQSKPHFRTDRLFEEGGQWYVRVRGGGVRGPFEDEVEAINQLEIFIRQSESGLLPADGKLVLDEKYSVDSVG